MFGLRQECSDLCDSKGWDTTSEKCLADCLSCIVNGVRALVLREGGAQVTAMSPQRLGKLGTSSWERGFRSSCVMLVTQECKPGIAFVECGHG